EPEERIGPPHAGYCKTCEQDRVGGDLRPELFIEMPQPLPPWPCGIPERVEDMRLALLVAGLPRNIAPELAAVARLGDRKRLGQHEIGIVLLLGARMMGEMIAAVRERFGEERIGAEPLAEKQVALFAARQAAVRAVMHQDRQAQLARTDQDDRNDV